LSSDEIEELFKAVEKCPNCGSSEGFWLATKLEKKFLQCKHCGALIELCEILQGEDAESKGGFKVLKRDH
jgi:transcription elongation factor Elf1